MPNIIRFENAKDHPICFAYKGAQIHLWHKGDFVKAKGGIPVVVAEWDAPHYAQLGLVPVFDQAAQPVVVQEPKTLNEESDDLEAPVNPEWANDRVDSVESNVASEHLSDAYAFIEKGQLTPGDLVNPERLRCVKMGGEWVFLLNNYKSVNPASVKGHIRAVFGKDLLEKVVWE